MSCLFINQVVNDHVTDILITPDNLGDYVGKPVFSSDKMYANTPVRKKPTKMKIQRLCLENFVQTKLPGGSVYGLKSRRC